MGLAVQSIEIKTVLNGSWMVFAAALFVLPLSSTLRGIVMALIVGLVALTPVFRERLLLLFKEPWCQAAGALFAVVLFSCAVGPASGHDAGLVLKKYTKLLFLPFLVVGFCDPRARTWGLNAFLAAMGITCGLSFLKAAGWIRYHTADPGQVFMNHIMTGFMISFAAYIAIVLALRSQGLLRGFYVALCITFSYQVLFIGTGCTGYVIYACLIGLLLFQVLPWRKAFLSLMMASVLLGAVFYQSTVMQTEVKKGVASVWQFQQGQKNTRIGYRLQFHAYAKQLWERHPWFGNGTGSYTYFFKTENPFPAWEKESPAARQSFEPHSEYWLMAVESGAVGVLALLVLFGCLLRAGIQLHAMRVIAIGIIIPFMLGNLSDSFLFYSGTGYFFLVFIALCLGERYQMATDSSGV